MGIVDRVCRIFKSNVNSALDDIEDSIKMTKEGIRELRVKLSEATRALATAKANAIRAKREYESALIKPQEYEDKAMALLAKVEAGSLSTEEGDLLATEALTKKEGFEKEVVNRRQIWENLRTNANKFEEVVGKLKMEIETWDNKVQSLKSRKDLADSQVVLHQQRSSLPSSTLDMLRKMEEKVEQAEALAEANLEISVATRSTDDKINDALATPANTSGALDTLKRKRDANKTAK